MARRSSAGADETTAETWLTLWRSSAMSAGHDPRDVAGIIAAVLKQPRRMRVEAGARGVSAHELHQPGWRPAVASRHPKVVVDVQRQVKLALKFFARVAEAPTRRVTLQVLTSPPLHHLFFSDWFSAM
jgi:hypothetical protein